LKESGVIARKRPKKWIISPANKIKRLRWAKLMLKVDESEWRKIVFSDESLIAKGFEGRYAHSKVGDTKIYDFAMQSNRWGPRVHVWGAISYDGIVSLEFLNENVTSNSYKELLERRLSPLLSQFEAGDLIFQQDGAPAHTSGLVTTYLHSKKITVLPWPPQSPDLNLIENVWRNMKNRLKANYDTEMELRASVLQEWEGLKDSFIKKLYNGMRKRLQAVVRAKGGPTRY
jgi:transposase